MRTDVRVCNGMQRDGEVEVDVDVEADVDVCDDGWGRVGDKGDGGDRDDREVIAAVRGG